MAHPNISFTASKSPLRTLNNIKLNYDELNEELKTNNERIYKLVDSLSNQKISADIANPIINEFKARNEYLRQVIGDIYKSRLQDPQITPELNRNVVINNTQNSQPTQASNTGAIRECYSTRQMPNLMSTEESVEAKRLREISQILCHFPSTHAEWVASKTTWKTQRDRGYDRLVGISAHKRMFGGTFFSVTLQQGESKRTRAIFVMEVLDVYHANKYLLKRYVDKIKNEKQILYGTSLVLKYIRTTQLDKLEQGRIFAAQKAEQIERFEANRARKRARERNKDLTDLEP